MRHPYRFPRKCEDKKALLGQILGETDVNGAFRTKIHIKEAFPEEILARNRLWINQIACGAGKAGSFKDGTYSIKPELLANSYEIQRPNAKKFQNGLWGVAITRQCQLSRIPAAAAIRTRDDFEQVTVRIFEIETASTVMVIGFAWLSLARISPVTKVSLSNSIEYRVEFCVTDQEGVVLAYDLTFRIHIVEICIVVGRDHVERPPAPRRRQTQHIGQEICRGLTVSSRQDGMIEMDGHIGLTEKSRSFNAVGFAG
ncbi:hypothetical protein ACVJBD_000707 [Rhizobium mongolense]